MRIAKIAGISRYKVVRSLKSRFLLRETNDIKHLLCKNIKLMIAVLLFAGTGSLQSQITDQSLIQNRVVQMSAVFCASSQSIDTIARVLGQDIESLKKDRAIAVAVGLMGTAEKARSDQRWAKVRFFAARAAGFINSAKGGGKAPLANSVKLCALARVYESDLALGRASSAASRASFIAAIPSKSSTVEAFTLGGIVSDFTNDGFVSEGLSLNQTLVGSDSKPGITRLNAYYMIGMKDASENVPIPMHALTVKRTGLDNGDAIPYYALSEAYVAVGRFKGPIGARSLAIFLSQDSDLLRIIREQNPELMAEALFAVLKTFPVDEEKQVEFVEMLRSLNGNRVILEPSRRAKISSYLYKLRNVPNMKPSALKILDVEEKKLLSLSSSQSNDRSILLNAGAFGKTMIVENLGTLADRYIGITPAKASREAEQIIRWREIVRSDRLSTLLAMQALQSVDKSFVSAINDLSTALIQNDVREMRQDQAVMRLLPNDPNYKGNLDRWISGESGKDSEVIIPLDQIERVRKGLQRNFGQSSPVVDASKIAPLLQPDEAVVSVTLTEGSAFTTLLRKDSVVVFRNSGTSSKLAALSRQMQASLDRDRPEAFRFDVAHALYEKLFAPIEAQMAGVKRLYWVADGDLAGIPISALLNKPYSKGQRTGSTPWLIQRYEITELPSLSSFFWVKRTVANPISRGLVGIGAPLLTHSNNSTDALMGTKLTGIDSSQELISRLETLPNAKKYLDELATLFPGRTDTFTEAEATKANLTRLDGRASLLAFATHGFSASAAFDLEQPWLVLTPKNDADSVYSTVEIAFSRLSAQLVLLTACSSLTADGLPGKGTVGSLAHAFIANGSASVIGSRWPVSEPVSLAMMKRLVMLARDGMTSGQALRKVQLERIAAGDRVADWAAFTIVGDGNAKVK